MLAHCVVGACGSVGVVAKRKAQGAHACALVEEDLERATQRREKHSGGTCRKLS